MHKINVHIKTIISYLLISTTAVSFFCAKNIQSEAAEVTLTSDTNYVDMTKYTQVLLPTRKTLAFALDPQGLSTMSDSRTSTDRTSASAGRIVSNGEVSIVNYSYYPLEAKVSFYITDTGKSNFLDTAADIDFDTEKNICLTVTPSSTKTTVTTNSNNAITDTDGYTASDQNIAITGSTSASANSIVFALSGADYNLDKSSDSDGNIAYSAERDLIGDYDVATFKIGGFINTQADWSSYIGRNAKSIKLNAVFSYNIITNEEYTYLTDSQSSHIQPGTYNMLADADSLVSANN